MGRMSRMLRSHACSDGALDAALGGWSARRGGGARWLFGPRRAEHPAPDHTGSDDK